MQSMILKISIIITLSSALFVLLRYGGHRLKGTHPMPLFTFVAILFCAGLDAGLVMLPLTEFPEYASKPEYQFANPVAIEFGFWGFLVWGFYFLTAFYFCVIEPKLKLFEIPVIKFLNNFVTIATCAFTAFLFFSNLPTYIDGITNMQRYMMVAVVIFASVYSSSDIKFVRLLSVGSTWLFLMLIVGVWYDSKVGGIGFLHNLSLVGAYFENLPKFVLPINEYHEFYLLWWFSWSVMIGQFMARFANNVTVRQLAVAMMIVPSIPLAIWFSVLYGLFVNSSTISFFWKSSMVVVGVLFVINSLDSLIRLYSDNLKWSVKRLGFYKYFAINSAVMFSLVGLYMFTPLKIEWIGMIICCIYYVVIVMMFIRRKQVQEIFSKKEHDEMVETV